MIATDGSIDGQSFFVYSFLNVMIVCWYYFHSSLDKDWAISFHYWMFAIEI
jgi:hypothetical protein